MPPKRTMRQLHESCKGGEAPQTVKDIAVKEPTSVPINSGRGKRKVSNSLLEANAQSPDNEVKLVVEEKPSVEFSYKRMLRSSSVKDTNIDICSSVLQPKKRRSYSIKSKNLDFVKEGSLPSESLTSSNQEAEDKAKMPPLKEDGFGSSMKKERFEYTEVTLTTNSLTKRRQRYCPPSCTVTADTSLTNLDKESLSKDKTVCDKSSVDTTNVTEQCYSALEKIDSYDLSLKTNTELEPACFFVKDSVRKNMSDQNIATVGLKEDSGSRLHQSGATDEKYVSELTTSNNSRTRDLVHNIERMCSKNKTDCLMFELEEDFKPDYDEDDKPVVSGKVSKPIKDCEDFQNSNSPYRTIDSSKCSINLPSPSLHDFYTSGLNLSSSETVYVKVFDEQMKSPTTVKPHPDNALPSTVESTTVEIENITGADVSHIMPCHLLESQLSTTKISGIHAIRKYKSGSDSQISRLLVKKSQDAGEKVSHGEDLKAVQAQTSPGMSVVCDSSKFNLAEIAVESELSEKHGLNIGVNDALKRNIKNLDIKSEKQSTSEREVTQLLTDNLLTGQTREAQIFQELPVPQAKEESVEIPFSSVACGYRKIGDKALLRSKSAVCPTLTVTETTLQRALQPTTSVNAEVSRPRIRLKRPWKVNAVQSSVISNEVLDQSATVSTSEPTLVEAVSLVENNSESVEAVSTIQNSPVLSVASVNLNPIEDMVAEVLEGDASPSEDSCYEDLRSSISVASGAGTDLSLSSLVQPQSDQQCKVLSTMSESTCSNSTATVSSSNVKKVAEGVSRKELNTSRDSEESDFRTSDLVELVVDDYANEFDDDICLPYESSTCIEESPASESHVTSAVAEANTGSNDGEPKVAVQRPKQGQRLCSQKHGNQSHTQVPSSGEVWLPAAFKSQSSNIGGGAGRGAKAGRVDNEDKSLKKGRLANRSVRQTGSSTVVSLLDIKLKNIPKSRPSGLSAPQCNANKNLRFSKPFDSGASDKRNFHMIKDFAEKKDWKSLAVLLLSTNLRRFDILSFATCLINCNIDIAQCFEKLMINLLASTLPDIQLNKKDIIGAIGINFIEKCLASGKLETAFEVLNKMLERKIHFYLLSSHSDSAGSGSIVQTAVNVFLSLKRYDMVSCLLTEFNYFRCHSEIKRGNVAMAIERKYCCLNAVLVEVHRHLTIVDTVTIDKAKVSLSKTGIAALTEILEDWDNDVKLQPRITQLMELSSVLDLLVSGCICQGYSSGLIHLSVLQERYPHYLDWKTPTIHAVLEFFLRQNMVNVLLSDEQPTSFAKLAVERNLITFSEYIPYSEGILTLSPKLSSPEMKLIICAYMKSILIKARGYDLSAIQWGIHLEDSAQLARSTFSIASSMATLQNVLSSMKPPLRWRSLSPSRLCFDSCSVADMSNILSNFGVVLKPGDIDMRQLVWSRGQSIAEPEAGPSNLFSLSSMASKHRYMPNSSIMSRSVESGLPNIKSDSYVHQEYSQEVLSGTLESASKSSQSCTITNMKSEGASERSRNPLHGALYQTPQSSPQASITPGRKVLLKTPETIEESPQLLKADIPMEKKSSYLNVSFPPIPRSYGPSSFSVDIRPSLSVAPSNQRMHMNTLTVGKTRPYRFESSPSSLRMNVSAFNEQHSCDLRNKNLRQSIPRKGQSFR